MTTVFDSFQGKPLIAPDDLVFDQLSAAAFHSTVRAIEVSSNVPSFSRRLVDNKRPKTGVLMLAAAQGMRITITCTGARAAECLKEMAQLIANRFGEAR